MVLAGLLWRDIWPNSADLSPSDTLTDNATQTQVEVSPSPEVTVEFPCSDTTENGHPNQIVLGALLFNIDNFFETVGQGMEAAAAEEDVEILFDSANTQEAGQNRILENYVAQKVDVILFSPIDEKTVSPTVKPW